MWFRTVGKVSLPSESELPLAEELQAFDERRAELLGEAPGKFALVHGQVIVGTYDTQADAIAEGYRRFGNVPFLVKRIAAVDAPEQFVSNLFDR